MVSSHVAASTSCRLLGLYVRHMDRKVKSSGPGAEIKEDLLPLLHLHTGNIHENYRSINLLTITSKLFENIMSDQITEYYLVHRCPPTEKGTVVNMLFCVWLNIGVRPLITVIPSVQSRWTFRELLTKCPTLFLLLNLKHTVCPWMRVIWLSAIWEIVIIELKSWVDIVIGPL